VVNIPSSVKVQAGSWMKGKRCKAKEAKWSLTMKNWTFEIKLLFFKGDLIQRRSQIWE
jgi:hypothetical protein